MPRIASICALALVGACTFDAVYTGGHYTCSDGKCPSGYTCSKSQQCVLPDSGTGSGSADAAIDAPQAALTCSDPGTFGAMGGSASGTTAPPRSNTVSASCNGSVMNGPDAVYKFDASIGQQVTASIAASYAATAYVIAPCSVTPATPACETNAYATPGNPLAFSAPATTTYYLVVDGVNPSLSGTYTVTLSLP